MKEEKKVSDEVKKLLDQKNRIEIEQKEINPNPKNIFRIWFLFYEIDNEIEIAKPESIIPSRDGYTMIEWGGIVAE